MSDQASERRVWVAAGAILVGLSLFYVLTLQPGHNWGGDFAHYLSHARNLSEGRAYSDTCYVYDPQVPGIGPRTYPPGFPVLLSLPYRVFGYDLELLKAYNALFFIAALALLYLAARRVLSPARAILLLPVVGLNPGLWDYKSYLQSEFAFMMFVLAALLLFDSLGSEGSSRKRQLLVGLVVGALSYFAYATRAIGVVLLPTFLVHDLLRLRRIRAATLVIFLVCVPAMLYQDQQLSVLEDYSRTIGERQEITTSQGIASYLGNARSNGRALPFVLSRSWQGDLPLWFEVPMAALLFALAGWGVWSSLVKGRFTAATVFAGGYIAAIMLVPFIVLLRWLVPVIPIFFFLVLLGLEEFPGGGRRRRVATAVLAGLLLISYTELFLRLEPNPPPAGVHHATAQNLFEYVRRETPADSVIAFAKPRVLCFFTERRTAAYRRQIEPQELLERFHTLGITHMIVTRDSGDDSLAAFVAAYSESLEEIYRNPGFTVYTWRRSEPPAANLASTGTSASG